MSLLERIPAFDFETTTACTVAVDAVDAADDAADGDADGDAKETTSASTARACASSGASLEEFRAIYDVFQCVCFRRKKTRKQTKKKGKHNTKEQENENNNEKHNNENEKHEHEHEHEPEIEKASNSIHIRGKQTATRRPQNMNEIDNNNNEKTIVLQPNNDETCNSTIGITTAIRTRKTAITSSRSTTATSEARTSSLTTSNSTSTSTTPAAAAARKRRRKRNRTCEVAASTTPSPSSTTSSSNSVTTTTTATESVVGLIRKTYESASLNDKRSWNVENNDDDNDDTNVGSSFCYSPLDFLGGNIRKHKHSGTNYPHTTNTNTANGYCSFVLQDDSNKAVANFSKRLEQLLFARRGASASAGGNSNANAKANATMKGQLPYRLLFPTNSNTNDDDDDNYKSKKNASTSGVNGSRTTTKPKPTQIRVAPHYWMFVGRNSHSNNNSNARNDNSNNDNDNALPGRKEHTDAISHDGTVHYQLEGSKVWKLRPTLELRQKCDQDYDVALLAPNNANNSNSKDANSNHYYEVCMEQGDFLVINTRLWWHQTMIPPQQNKQSTSSCYSVSIARDIYLDRQYEDEQYPTASWDANEYEHANEHANTNHRRNRKNNLEINNDDDDENDSIPSDDSSSMNTNTNSKKQKHESMSNVDASWATGFIPKGTVLLVDHVTIDDNDDDDDSNDDANNDDDFDNDFNCHYNFRDKNDIPSRYYNLLPPTIGHTGLESKANCRLVVVPTQQSSTGASSDDEDKSSSGNGNGNGNDNDNDNDNSNGDCHEGRPEEIDRGENEHSYNKRRTKQKRIALKTIRDIQDGDEFVLLRL